MHQALYVLSVLCLAVALIFANLSDPPVSPYLVGGGLGASAVIFAVAGRALQLLEDIRNEVAEG
jgi:hypothetical protein